MTNRFCLLGAVLLTSSFAFAVSFEGHTTFTANPMRGWLHVTCDDSGRFDNAQVICRDVLLTPFEYGYFNAETDTGATEARLTSHRADGRLVKKSLSYDSTKGQSIKRVNLWIDTLLQRALLDVGENTIDYVLMAGDEMKATGQIKIQVDGGEVLECPTGHMFSHSKFDCDFPQSLCGRYFERFNYCESEAEAGRSRITRL